VASTREDALVAKRILSIEWSESAASAHNSQETYTAYEKMASSSQPGKVLEEK
jgi:isoquinoline 1-oxidoreductase beta subunit